MRRTGRQWIAGRSVLRQQPVCFSLLGNPQPLAGFDYRGAVDGGQAFIAARSMVGSQPDHRPCQRVVIELVGYPAQGVWRVRDVSQNAESYRFGGAPLDNNHTRIIDLALSATYTPDQSILLGTYPSSAQPIDGKGPDDFAIIPLIAVIK